MMPKIDSAVQQSHNRRNTLHTVLLIAGTWLIMGILAYTMFGWIGLVGATAFGAFGILSLGRVSPKMVLGLYKARPLLQHEAPDLHTIIQELSTR
jgi:heat shock protein HtpX